MIKWKLAESTESCSYGDLIKVTPSCTNNDNNKKKDKAFEMACDIRKFEIGLFWTRTAFFWGFITAIYVAYFSILNITDEKSIFLNTLIFNKFTLQSCLRLIFSFLGTLFCFAYVLVSKASKHWQENWENHVDLLEDEITGSLYKTFKKGDAPSVSKVCIFAGCVLLVCAAIGCMYEIFNIANHDMLMGGIVCILEFSFFIYMYIATLGNQKSSGEIHFVKKEYSQS